MINIKALIEKSKTDIETSNGIRLENKTFLSADSMQKREVNKSIMIFPKQKDKTKEQGMQMGS